MLFIHEVATDHRLWHSQRDYFSSAYRLISIDVLGHGPFEWPRRELSIERAALQVRQLLKRLGTESTFVIGVSMGAALAMRMALDTPELVRGLVLISPWRYLDDHARNLIDRLLRVIETKDMAAYVDLLLRYTLPSVAMERYPPNAAWLRAMALAQNTATVVAAWTACLAFDVRNQLGRIRAPSLVVAGMDDLFTPPYLARAVAEELPAKELEIWDGHSHFPFLEDPERFNRRIDAFIRSCINPVGAE